MLSRSVRFGMGMGMPSYTPAMPSYTPPMTTAPMSYAQPMPTTYAVARIERWESGMCTVLAGVTQSAVCSDVVFLPA